MAEWITLDTLTRTSSGGKAMSASIADTVNIHVEASPEHRDIRVNDSNHIIKIRLDDDWTIRDILVDDTHAWTTDDE